MRKFTFTKQQENDEREFSEEDSEQIIYSSYAEESFEASLSQKSPSVQSEPAEPDPEPIQEEEEIV